MTRFFYSSITGLAYGLFASASIWPATCALDNGIGLPPINTINVTGGFASTVLQGAVSRWESRCVDWGHDFPDLRVNTGSELTVSVQFFNRRRDDTPPSLGNACEKTTVSTSGGEMVGATITIWALERDGTSCEGSTEELLAHGLGHALGFDDAYSSSCDGTIMGRKIPGQPMFVLAEHCSLLDILWHTDIETDPCRDPEANRCECDPWECGSPIVLDLDGRGFRFTGLEEGVWFDINADGIAELISWTQNGSEGFLGLDRNGNGALDNGGELFGNFTRRLDGSIFPHGYAALGDFDTFTLLGNGDGVITASDAVFSQLQVWRDWNQDGLSQPSELFRLEELGILRLELNFTTQRRRDRHGNLLLYASKAWVDGPGNSEIAVATTDVFFLVGQP